MRCLRRIRHTLSLAGVLLLSLSAVPVPADDWALDALRGRVEIARSGLPIWEPARPGQTLTAGDALRIPDAGHAQLTAAGVTLDLSDETTLRLETEQPGALESVYLENGRCRASVSRRGLARDLRLRADALTVSLGSGAVDVAVKGETAVLRVERGSARVAGRAPGAPHAIELHAGFGATWPDAAPFEIALALPRPGPLPAAPEAEPGTAGAASEQTRTAPPRLRATLIPGQSGAGEIAVEGDSGPLQTLSPRQILGVLRGEPGILHPELAALLEASGIAPDRFATQLAAML